MKIFTYLCPACQDEFSYAHHPNKTEDPAPRFCPNCGFDSEVEDYQAAVTAPHISSARARSVDGHRRAMEEGADFRVEMAKQMGLDIDQANVLKDTNARDNLREGDTSDIPVNNPVSQLMEAAPSGAVGFQSEAALAYSGPVSTGPYPNAGIRALGPLRQAHARFTAEAGHAGSTSSSRDSLEYNSPLYRKRTA